MILDFENGAFIHQEDERVTFIKFNAFVSEIQEVEFGKQEPEIAIILLLDSDYIVTLLFNSVFDREKAQNSIVKAVMERENKYIDLVEYEVKSFIIAEVSNQFIEENINES